MMKKLVTGFSIFFCAVMSLTSEAQMASNNLRSTGENDSKDLISPRTDLLRTHTGDFIFGPATRIKFKIIEQQSGLQTTYFKVSDFPYMKSDGRQMMPHGLPDGEYKMLYYSIDKGGNQEQIRTDMIYLDKLGPKVSATFNATPSSYKDGIPVYQAGVQLLIEIADEKVDVQKVTYKINDRPKIESEELHAIDLTSEIKQVGGETIKIEVIAYDTFYNISKKTIEFEISR